MTLKVKPQHKNPNPRGHEIYNFSRPFLGHHYYTYLFCLNHALEQKEDYFTNKRPMGHIVHLRKQFKSINTYDYIITLIRRRKNPLNCMVCYLNKLQSPSPKGALCKVWLKLSQWFWKRFLNFVNAFLLLPDYLPLVKTWPFI